MTVIPDTTQLETHLRNVQSALSKELDEIRPWDDEQAKAGKLAKAERTARFDGVKLPETGFVRASTEGQEVKVSLTLKLIVGDYRSGNSDPRGEAFKALARDLVAMVPSETTVQHKLEVGIGVARSFPPTVATETVRGWAAEVFPVLQILARAGLHSMERHNAVVDLIIDEQRAAMARAEELTTELQEFKLN